MRGLAAKRLGGWTLLAAAVLTAQPLNRLTGQQVASNRASAYLFPTNAEDVRAIWVNPAGLGVQRDASIYGELGVGDPGSKGRLRQINVGFNSSGLAFAYQRDILDNGVRGSTYRLGLGGSAAGLAAGFDVARYGGNGANATGWDLGLRYAARPSFILGFVAANIGQPIVRGLRQRLTFLPGLTWQPPPLAALGLSAAARITPDSVIAYNFGLSWRAGAQRRWPIEILARLDTDGGLRRGAFAFGVAIGGQDRFGAVVTTPGDVSRIDEASIYGLTAREPSHGRH
ncbi:MAG TPA: hypothetical protein VL549_12595 [Gemmatimonadales bacterium]|nr:hypothetical protein [Gemmatimonadales bacterium]